jgi:hypothetical protein
MCVYSQHLHTTSVFRMYIYFYLPRFLKLLSNTIPNQPFSKATHIDDDTQKAMWQFERRERKQDPGMGRMMMAEEWEIKKYFCNEKLLPQSNLASPSIFLFKAFADLRNPFFALVSLEACASTNHVFDSHDSNQSFGDVYVIT